MENDPENPAFAELAVGQGEAEPVAEELKKQQKIELERTKLLQAVTGGDFSTLTAKVAGILNIYPDARNSDVVLSLRLWATFQPEIYNEQGIKPADLFKLERMPYITRARAKIQNEYGLFLADEAVRGHRKGREADMHDAVLEDANPSPVINVFADESGKTADWVIVSAVWVLSGRAVFEVQRAIESWRKNSVWSTREVHFSNFGRADIAPLREYLDVIRANRNFLSFKLAAVERAGTRRTIEEVVRKLHEHMLRIGMRHELESGRVDLPRRIYVSLDEEQSLDKFALRETKDQLNADFIRDYGEGVTLVELLTASSKQSPLIQLADLIGGAVNRRLNHRGDRGHKDEMADMIVEQLGLDLTREGFDELDTVALFYI
jgi:hypothetical protein